jgi:hypothetical protein
VKLLERFLRDLAIHLPHAAFEVLDVKRLGLGGHLTFPGRGTVVEVASQ